MKKSILPTLPIFLFFLSSSALSQTDNEFTETFRQLQENTEAETTFSSISGDSNRHFIEEKTFYGHWASSQSSDHVSTNPTKSHKAFNTPKLITFSNKTSGMVLYESEYIDQESTHYIISFKEIFQMKNLNNGTFVVQNQKIQYWQGRGLDSTTADPKDCHMKELAFQFEKAQERRTDGFLAKKGEGFTLQIRAESEDCPLSFSSTVMKSYDEKVEFQVWVYLGLFFIWSIPNLLIILQKLIKFSRIEMSEVLQFFLVYHINFKISTWNTMLISKAIGGGITSVITVIDFFIWFPSLCLTFANISRMPNLYMVFALFPINGFLMAIILRFHFEPILIIFSLIPLVDLAKFLKKSTVIKYNYFLYIGVLLPGLMITGYLTLYSGNLLRLSPQPKYTPYFFTFVGLAFMVLPLQMTIKSIKLKIERSRNYADVKTIPAEEICPICAEFLLATEVKQIQETEEVLTTGNEQTDNENVQLAKRAKKPVKPQQQKVFITKCKHLFHEKCLKDWLQVKPECPSCRTDITHLIDLVSEK